MQTEKQSDENQGAANELHEEELPIGTKMIFDLSYLPNQDRNGPWRVVTKAWTKTVTSVDQSEGNGYAFKGEWLSGDTDEIPIGTYIMHFYIAGPKYKEKSTSVKLLQATEHGVYEIRKFYRLPKKWALGCRDEIAEMVNREVEQPNRLLEAIQAADAEDLNEVVELMTGDIAADDLRRAFEELC